MPITDHDVLIPSIRDKNTRPMKVPIAKSTPAAITKSSEDEIQGFPLFWYPMYHRMAIMSVEIANAIE